MKPDVRLLAIDVGLRLGWAAFGADGRLLAYGSRHFGTRGALRRAVPRILAEYPALRTLVVEGGGDLAKPWEKEAARRGIAYRRTHGEAWRGSTMPPSRRRSGEAAKETADELARAFIERSGAPKPTSLRHDAAEAILVGLWALGR